MVIGAKMKKNISVNIEIGKMQIFIEMQKMTESILDKALSLEFISLDEAKYLYKHATLGDLMSVAHQIRNILNNPQQVSWIVDRNVNISNRCVCGCKFCNFHVKPGSDGAYITTEEEYDEKINALIEKGGNQLLLQGGLDPKAGLDFYVSLFSDLKKRFPQIKLHALGPAEVHFIAQRSKLSVEEVLKTLVAAGLDSLPGAGAEILVDRVRTIVSPNKCTSDEWLNVMRVAHTLNLCTSATMMFGHVETIDERIEHLIKIRELHQNRPEGASGFSAFIAWPFQKSGTVLERDFPEIQTVSGEEYIRMVALSRIVLVNIKNIQASWLTVGKDIGQMCLFAGANDLGSIMIEENVVSAAGAHYTMTAEQMVATIEEAGFTPLKRNQDYTPYL